MVKNLNLLPDKNFIAINNSLHEKIGIPTIIPLGNMSICKYNENNYLLAIRQFNYTFLNSDCTTYKIIEDDFFFGRNYFFVLVDKQFNFLKKLYIENNTPLDLKLLEDVKLLKNGNILHICGTYIEDKQIQIAILSCLCKEDCLITTTGYYLSGQNYSAPQKNWMQVPDRHLLFIKDIEYKRVVFFDIANGEIIVNSPNALPFRGNCSLVKYNSSYYIGLVHKRENAIYSFSLIIFDKNLNILNYSSSFKFTNAPIEFSCGFIIDNGEFIIPVTENDSITTFFKVDAKYLFTKVNLI